MEKRFDNTAIVSPAGSGFLEASQKQQMLYLELMKTEDLLFKQCSHTYINVTEYRSFVKEGVWLEGWLDENGQWAEQEVKGEVWTEVIQKALDKNREVYIPFLGKSVYIDRPLILHSGNVLKVHPETEIRLKPFTNTCMLRNENIVSGHKGPVSPGEYRDEDIVVEGGIWNAMSNGKPGGNGNREGWSDREGKIPGAHGTIIFSNVCSVKLSNMRVRESTPFSVQIGNCMDFLIEDIEFQNNHRDGIHIEGPAERGVIRKVRGKTGDDIIALNAWDWKNYSMTFGPIANILVENVEGIAGHIWSEIRLLAGTKLFERGIQLECDIKDCIFNNIKNIHTVKIYTQPNLELGREVDYSGSVGQLDNIYFKNISIEAVDERIYYCKKDAIFEICSNINNISIEDVTVNFPLEDSKAGSLKLVAVGPMSGTWKYDSCDISKWVEIFEPNTICCVDNLYIKNIIARNCKSREYKVCTDPDLLVMMRKQTVNPDYPVTIPGGGTGYGAINKINIFK